MFLQIYKFKQQIIISNISLIITPNNQMSKDKQVIYKLKCISIVSLVFMTVQIVGGMMANSIAILADAFHLLSDVLAYVISLQAVLMSHKKPPFFMTFGYEKIQPLGALVNVAIIWFVTLQLLIQATQRIINKSVVEDPLYMLLTSFFGLGCNLYIMRVLHSDVQHGGHQGCSHAHGLEHHHGDAHGHQHQHEHKHKHGEKCSHDHGHEKKAIKQEHNHDKNCSHGHGHGHVHHNHKHTKPVEIKPHDHNHDHQHNQNNQHKHDHHDHNEHTNNHKNHDNHDHGHKHGPGCSHNKIDYSSNNSTRNFTAEQSPVAITNQSLNQQIKLQEHVSCGLDLPQLNISDESLRIMQKQKARKQLFENINIQAAYIHIISDIILSIGVIISAIIIFFNADRQQWTYWQLADPLCTYLFSVMAIYSTIGIAKDSVIILLDGCDDANMLKQIISQLDSFEQIQSYSQLRVWSMNRSKFAAAVKILLAKQKFEDLKTRNQIHNRVVSLFSNRGITHYVQISEQQQKQLKEQ